MVRFAAKRWTDNSFVQFAYRFIGGLIRELLSYGLL